MIDKRHVIAEHNSHRFTAVKIVDFVLFVSATTQGTWFFGERTEGAAPVALVTRLRLIPRGQSWCLALVLDGVRDLVVASRKVLVYGNIDHAVDLVLIHIILHC